jgi:hypothetical protein
MMTVTQTTRLIAWAIVALIVVGILLYFFGPATLRTDELIVFGLLILALICFRTWLGRRGEWMFRRTRAMTARRFPPPWSVEEQAACFVVRDRSGQALAYVSFEDEPGRRSAARLLSKDEARRIAADFAKLSDLKGRMAVNDLLLCVPFS